MNMTNEEYLIKEGWTESSIVGEVVWRKRVDGDIVTIFEEAFDGEPLHILKECIAKMERKIKE